MPERKEKNTKQERFEISHDEDFNRSVKVIKDLYPDGGYLLWIRGSNRRKKCVDKENKESN